MIVLDRDKLQFSFPQVDEDARFQVSFIRTLRIPDDGRDYPLPPGFGSFRLRHVDDFADRVPSHWKARGGVMLPMHQNEALWIRLGQGFNRYPFAVKIATGKINAITGDPWSESLSRDPQDYVVSTKQLWIDGYRIGKGQVRQFVAAPLGVGATAEEQVTGLGAHGGIQIVAYPMKAEAYRRYFPTQHQIVMKNLGNVSAKEQRHLREHTLDFGLAPGGRIKQKIYEDTYSVDDWDTEQSSRCFVAIANATSWGVITGENWPHLPPSAKDYSDAGLPWFHFDDDSAKPLPDVSNLAALRGVGHNIDPIWGSMDDPDKPVEPKTVIDLSPRRVREGQI